VWVNGLEKGCHLEGCETSDLPVRKKEERRERRIRERENGLERGKHMYRKEIRLDSEKEDKVREGVA
jgi:hypothetical protein